MKRLLLLTLLITACSGSTGPNVQSRFVVYVDGTNTGTPGPYCHVSMNSPALLSLDSKPGVTDSAVAMVNVKSGRYPFSWQVDYFNSSGVYQASLNSQFSDSTDVPGSAYFFC